MLQLGFTGGSVVKNPPENVDISGATILIPFGEDPLKEEKATYFSILTWKKKKILWTEEHSRLWPMGVHRVLQDWATEHVHML